MIRSLLSAVFTIFSTLALAQPQVVTGRVTSSTEPDGLPGVNVVVKGTSQGVITDMEGRFSLEAEPDAVLIFSFVGYKSQELLVGNQTSLNVILEEEAQELNEVIVMGYSSVERRDITGSVSSVKANAFKD